MQEIVKFGHTKVYIRKTSGRTYKRNNEGEYAPILYETALNEEQPLCLVIYSELKGISTQQALSELVECGASLSGYAMNIQFFNEESLEKFKKLLVVEEERALSAVV